MIPFLIYFQLGVTFPLVALDKINLRQLRAIRMGLMECVQLLRQGRGSVCDNTTAVAYLKKDGGTRSEVLSREAQAILGWSEQNIMNWGGKI